MEKGITQSAKHTLMLDGRSRAKLTGVTAVSCFNDREVVLETGEGEVALLGENLHIEQLNLDDGQLDVTGEIVASSMKRRAKRSGADFLDEKKHDGAGTGASAGDDGNAGRGARRNL